MDRGAGCGRESAAAAGGESAGTTDDGVPTRAAGDEEP